MKLTAILFKHHPIFMGKIPKFRGSALSGKHKFVPYATRGTRFLLWHDYKNQEEVMKYTSTPYITPEEEAKYLELDLDPLHTSIIETPMRQRYATDILNYFERSRKHEVWD